MTEEPVLTSRVQEHEGRLASIETMLEQVARNMRDLSAAARDRDRHVDTLVADLRTHVDDKIDALSTLVTRSRESKPAVMVGIVAVLLSFATAAGAIIVLAISNATGPLETSVEAKEEAFHALLDAHMTHTELPGHSMSMTMHEGTRQQLASLQSKISSFQSEGGGRWTKNDQIRFSDIVHEEYDHFQERLLKLEITSARQDERLNRVTE